MDRLKAEAEKTEQALPRWLWLIALVLGLLLLVRLAEPPYPRFDSGAYVLGARALARGMGLVSINHPDLAPFTIYPPVLPAYLSLFARISESLAMLKLGIILSGALCLLLTLRYYGRSWGPLISGLALLAMAGSTFYLFCGRIQGEAPYLAWTLAALLCLEQSVKRDRLGAHFWVGLACVLCAALTRQIGIALIVGAALYLLLRMSGAWRKLLAVGALALFVALPYYLTIETLQPGNLSPSQTSVLRTKGWSPNGGQIDPLSHKLVQRVEDNLERASWYAPQSLLLREDRESRGVRWALRALFGLMAIGWLYSLIRRRRAADFYVPPYLGVVLIIPWLVENRFFTVLIPFMLDYLVCGVFAVGGIVTFALRRDRRSLERPARKVAVALLALIALINIGLLSTYDGRNKWCARDNGAHAACIAATKLLDPGEIVLTHDSLAFSALTGIRSLSYMPGEQKYLEPFDIGPYMRSGGHIDAILFPRDDARRVARFIEQWDLVRVQLADAAGWNLLRVRARTDPGRISPL
ncbi:MAG: glycosyltransferase family 39 protein [Candidatus Alcyoniella australis]|nr:glycosyltransferase family 39 protein [Candidatus Alcyoniella australis]